MFLSILPGLGTVLNMFFGLFVDMVSETKLIPMPGNFTNRFIMLMIAMIMYCTGIYLYLSCRLGAGPKDGLMLGFSKKFKLTISHTRIIIESFVLIVGFFLGGPLGIGTVVLAILTGPILQKIFRFAKIDPKKDIWI